MPKKSKRAQKVLDQIKAQRGLDRKHYFEEGGEMVRWRGLHQVIPDKRKQENKRRARKKVRYV